MKMLGFLIERLREPSTWRGIVAIATSLGITLSPELQNAIIAAGLGIIGLIAVMTKDKLS